MDEIYDFLQETGFCKHANDPDFMQFMERNNGKLRDSEPFDVMAVVEQYVTVWNKKLQEIYIEYVGKEFFGFMSKLGVLESIPSKERYGYVMNCLYYYCGVSALDLAEDS